MEFKGQQITRTIGKEEEPYIIAEIGGNHDGNLHKAKLLIDDAVRAGADCVKAQIFKTEELWSKEEKSYPAVRGYNTQFERMKSIELDHKSIEELATYCEETGIQFTASPWNEEAVDLLVKMKVPFIKVGSGDVSNLPLLKKIVKTKIPVVLSVGGARKEIIDKAMKILDKKNTVLLHCPLPYPTNHEDVNLQRMNFLEETYGTLVGYSDHTTTIDASIGATYLGATIIEKHFAHNKGYKCTGDHKVSAEPGELIELVKLAKRAHWQIGEAPEGLTEEAKEFGIKARRALTPKKDLAAGTILTEELFTGIRPENKGIPVHEINKVLGKKLNKDLKEGFYLKEEDFN